MYLKTLTLDYDFFDNEYFELSVINDQRIELFHPSSETVYEFTGRGYIQFLREADASGKRKLKVQKQLKKRKQKTAKKDNPRVNTKGAKFWLVNLVSRNVHSFI